MNYDDPITCLKGIGEKTAALYEKLGIVTIGELMRYYPRSYERFEPPVTIRGRSCNGFRSGPGRDLFLSDNKACA